MARNGRPPIALDTRMSALRVLAEHNGNRAAAIRQLKAEGHPGATNGSLTKWRQEHWQQYEQMCAEANWIVAQRQARKLSQSADKAIDAQTQAVEMLLKGELKNVAPRDLATAARNLAQVGSISIEKAQLLKGQPTEITETRDPQELISLLQRLGVIEGEAVEETDEEGRSLEAA